MCLIIELTQWQFLQYVFNDRSSLLKRIISLQCFKYAFIYGNEMEFTEYMFSISETESLIHVTSSYYRSDFFPTLISDFSPAQSVARICLLVEKGFVRL